MVDWKKDIKLSDLLGRGKGDEEAREELEPFQPESYRPEPDAPSVGDEPFRAEHTDTQVEDAGEQSTPFWKRELSFRGRKDDSDVDTDLEGAADAERVPFWKRDLSFGRRDDEHEDAGPDLAAAPEPFEPAAASPFEGDYGEETPLSTHEVTFGLQEDSPHESDVDHVLDYPEPAPAPLSEGDYGEEVPLSTPELGFSAHEDSPPQTDLDHVVDYAEPVADVQEPVDAPVPEPYAVGEPAFRGDDTFEETQEMTSPAPVGRGEVAAPFWRRALSFGRRDDAADADDPDTYDKAEEKRSFFTLRRPKSPDAGSPAAEDDTRPFWKRDLSFPLGRSEGREVVAGLAPKAGRKKQLVGLKVGASQLAAAQIVNNGSPELVQLARQPIEQGIVVGGELRDPDALAEALRDFFSANKLPNRNVRLGIGNNRIGVRTFEISGIHDPKQLENAIRFRAQEALPIPLDEAVLDYHVIDESVSPTGIRTYRVLLVVAYRELVDRYLMACRGAGLRLVGIDLEAFALLRALSPPPSQGFPEDTALVVVSIGHDRSTFAVSSGRVCEFTRVLDWGGSSLNTAIARALDFAPSQAEPVKRTLALSEDDVAVATTADEQTAKAQEAVRLELQSFARELVSSLHFYQNQPGSLAIGTIVLTGGTAHMPGLAAELQRLIGVKVRVGDPLRRVKAVKGLEAPDQLGSMAVAIGLGIED